VVCARKSYFGVDGKVILRDARLFLDLERVSRLMICDLEFQKLVYCQDRLGIISRDANFCTSNCLKSAAVASSNDVRRNLRFVFKAY